MYKRYTGKEPINASVKVDLNKITSVLGSEDIEFDVSRYHYIFVFKDVNWSRNLFTKLERIFKRVVNEISLSHTDNGRLKVIFNRFDNI